MKRFLLAIVALAVVLAAGTAFAASINVSSTILGAGATPVTGYGATNVSWNLNPTVPSKVDSVTFTLDHSASQLFVNTNTSEPAWQDCYNAINSDATPVVVATPADASSLTTCTFANALGTPVARDASGVTTLAISANDNPVQ